MFGIGLSKVYDGRYFKQKLSKVLYTDMWSKNCGISFTDVVQERKTIIDEIPCVLYVYTLYIPIQFRAK